MSITHNSETENVGENEPIQFGTYIASKDGGCVYKYKGVFWCYKNHLPCDEFWTMKEAICWLNGV